MKDIIKTEKLGFSYYGEDGTVAQKVLDRLDIKIQQGTFVVIIGHNGSGKTTLAKHFNATLLPMGGKVYVENMDTSDENLVIEVRRRVGMVFQNPDNQIVATVVEEDIAFAPENLGYPPEEIRRRVDEALKIVSMYEYRKHAPHLLSGGQKQRIAIAGVLAMRPKCIVFDEPTAMLDPGGRESVVKIMHELKEKHGVTVILITHHMDEAINADRLIVLSDGEILKDGKPKDVFKDIETLRKADLEIPETAKLLHALNTEGFNLPTDALTIDECAAAIHKALS